MISYLSYNIWICWCTIPTCYHCSSYKQNDRTHAIVIVRHIIVVQVAIAIHIELVGVVVVEVVRRQRPETTPKRTNNRSSTYLDNSPRLIYINSLIHNFFLTTCEDSSCEILSLQVFIFSLLVTPGIEMVFASLIYFSFFLPNILGVWNSSTIRLFLPHMASKLFPLLHLQTLFQV